MARDLAGFIDRVQALLIDSTGATWSDATVTEGLTHALEEYSRASIQPGSRLLPNQKIGTVTPTANLREVSLSTLTGLLSVSLVWFPYYGATPAYYASLPDWVEFEVWWDAGVPKLFMDIDGVPDGVQVARVFYNVLHTLKDLASATATSFSTADDSVIVLGAAGYACLQRGASASEKVIFNGADALKDYQAIGGRLLTEFRGQIAPYRFARMRRAR